MFKRILVPVDLTDKNSEAIAMATRLASFDDGEVWLLHIIEELEAPFDELKDFYARLEANANETLAEYAKNAQEDDVAVRTTVAFGKRVREIVEFANVNGIDLMVLTSHRLNPSDLGSSFMTISHQVALAADPPVLLLR